MIFLDGNNADDDYILIVTLDDLYNEYIPLKKCNNT